MLSFFFAHIRTHLFRNLSMVGIASLFVIVGSILLFLYQNSSKALLYYNYNIIDEKRFTISNDVSYFDMFSRNSNWLPSSLARELEQDRELSHVQSFSLVEIPVLARFSLFDFALETDIPIFSVTDSALTGAEMPIGISRAMIDFYNMKIAGTSSMLQKIPETFMRWQSVELTFGSSKLFPPLWKVASTIVGKITTIDENFPGFWLTLPESVVRDKMREVGYTLSPPYKIVAYMRDTSLISTIEKKYSEYKLQFDAYMLRDLRGQIDFMRNIFLSITLFFLVIFGIFFLFLLFSFFRERRDVFRIISIFWLSWLRARMITLAEPIFLLLSGGILWIALSYCIIQSLVYHWNSALLGRGISYILFPSNLSSFIFIWIGIFIFFGFVIFILESLWRRKTILR